MSPEEESIWTAYWEWILLAIILPLAMIVIGWLLAEIMRVPHPFLHTFGTAELLLISILFIIPVMLDLDRHGGRSALRAFHKSALLGSSILLVAMYSALRAYTQRLSARPDLSPEAIWLMEGVAAFSVALTIASVIYVLLVRYRVLLAQVENFKESA